MRAFGDGERVEIELNDWYRDLWKSGFRRGIGPPAWFRKIAGYVFNIL